MKKLFILIIIVMLSACTATDSSNNNDTVSNDDIIQEDSDTQLVEEIQEKESDEDNGIIARHHTKDLQMTLSDACVLTVSGKGPANSVRDVFKKPGVIGKCEESNTKLVLEEGITDISMLMYRAQFKSISIPSTIDVLDLNLWFGEEIIIADSHKTFKSIDGVVFSKDGSKLIRYPQDKKDESYTIPNSVKTIGEYAFRGNKNLHNINISNSVNTIEIGAFRFCTSLKSVYIPAGVSNIQTLEILDYFPDYTSFEGTILSGCTSLETIVVDENNPYYDSRNECNAIIETATNSLIQGCSTTIIPDTVSYLLTGSFENFDNITFMEIPNSVISIGPRVFDECRLLEYVIVPDSVMTIGDGAFMDCPLQPDLLEHLKALYGTNIDGNNLMIY